LAVADGYLPDKRSRRPSGTSSTSTRSSSPRPRRS